jgi:hypothetical protein
MSRWRTRSMGDDTFLTIGNFSLDTVACPSALLPRGVTGTEHRGLGFHNAGNVGETKGETVIHCQTPNPQDQVPMECA